MTGLEQAFVLGFFSGAVLAVPFSFVLAFFVIPRAVDFWTYMVRTSHRPHER